MTHKKVNTALFKKTVVTGTCILVIAVFLFLVFCPSAGAVGLVDDTVDAAHEYSRYPLENYQLDFYVDNRWDWLPWNWIDGIGKQVMYGLVLHHEFYLDNQFISFNASRLSGTGSIRAGLYFGCSGRDWTEHSVYRGHLPQRAFCGWVLCGLPPAYHPD